MDLPECGTGQAEVEDLLPGTADLCQLMGALPFLEDPVFSGRTLSCGILLPSHLPRKEQEASLPLSPGGPAAEEEAEPMACGPHQVPGGGLCAGTVSGPFFPFPLLLDS